MAEPSNPKQPSLWFWLKALQVRLRFFAFVAVLAALFALWPLMSATWDRWLSKWSRPADDVAVSGGSEFFCPMDPGVTSAWPAICPICNMDLIRRQKGDAQLLPEGVLARMQLSPYKLTLAGIRTVAIESVNDTDTHQSQSQSQTTDELSKLVRTVRVPVSAIVYREQQPLVYVESMPGMFDALPVTMTARDASTQVVSGNLLPGRRVVVMGALLLDAESRLKPNLSTQYFGAAQPSSLAASPPSLPTPASTIKADALSADDQQLVHLQEVCPITQAALGSMGTPVMIEVNGRRIALCCAGCRGRVLANPEKTIQWLDQRVPDTSRGGK